MNFPEKLNYSKEHTWLLVDGETGKIGITEFAQNELGEIVYIDMPRVGQTFKKNDVFGSVEAVKTTTDLFIPVSGIVKQINSKVVKEPSPVNDDPYLEGWLIEIQISDPSEIGNLLSVAEYKRTIGKY